MKWINKLWYVFFAIIVAWSYYIFISPRIFNSTTVEVPDVIGLSEMESRRVLEGLQIQYQITYTQSTEECTLKTIPYAGVKVKKKHTISVYIGKIIPESYQSFLGQVYENVIQDIERLCNDYGLQLKLEYEKNDSHVSGIIIRESITPGTLLKNGEILTLTISANEAYFLMPNLVGLSIYDALSILEEYQVKAKINYYTAPMDEDIVLYQSIAKDSIIKKGNPYEIDLYVSKGMATVNSQIDPYQLEEMLVSLGYQVEKMYMNSNEEKDKLVAFEVQKLYDNTMKYILWITK